MPLEDIKDLDKALRDAMGVIKELQSADKVTPSVIGKFHEILITVDSSLVKLRTAEAGDASETEPEGDSSETTGLFSSVSKDIRSIFESIATCKNYDIGEIVIEEGEVGDTLYIIESGKVMVYIDSGDTSLVLSTLSSGDFFGEMALLTSKPRSATVKALSDLFVLEIKGDDLTKAIYEHPQIIKEFAKQFEIRIKHMKKYLHMR
jgi:CRP-like cAMP-binding protein